MSPLPASSELAEMVALVTFSLSEALASYPEASLPGGYRFHLFDGFPGYCDHAATAGLILHRALAAFEVEAPIEIAHSYARRVVAAAVQRARPPSSGTLAGLAEEIRRSAVRNGMATLRLSAGAPERIAEDTTGRVGGVADASTAPWSVAFHLSQVYRTIVYADTEATAIDIARHLYDVGDLMHFERCLSVADNWQAQTEPRGER